jgi:hypothetical protein
VVAGGGGKPSGAGGEFFQRGLEWRRELCNDCKPFLDREGLGLILIFHIESTPALSFFLLQPFWKYIFTLYKVNIISNHISNLKGKYVQFLWTNCPKSQWSYMYKKKVDIFGRECSRSVVVNHAIPFSGFGDD